MCIRDSSICGQAPSLYPEFAALLVKEGIDSISANPDSVIRTRRSVAGAERKELLKRPGTKEFQF